MSGRYADFSVGIESAAGGGYLVRAFSSRAEAESLLQLEFDLGGLNERLRSRISSALPGPRVRDLAGGAGSPSAGPGLVELGRALFAGLFTGEVGELYSAAWSAALEAGHGLRLRLHLRPRNPELAWLTKIPWEILFDDRAGSFPCLNPLSPLIRHLDLPRPVEQAPFRLPLRVLVVAASPAGLSALDLKGEQEAMGASGQVQVKVLEGPGPEDLRWELQRGKYQVVHFMGHGLSDSAQGSLVFSTPEGRPRLVSGSALSHLVQGAPALSLTLLNACHSAAVPKGSGADPLSGVAGALVRGGQAAVVGMQLAIPDRAALQFSKVLYARLAEGDPIEAAVSEARLALYLADPDASDWVAPVLFLRGSDPRIEEAEMKERRPEKDVTRVDYEADVIRGGRIIVQGEAVKGGSKDRSEERARDVHVRVKTKKTDVNELRITGSDRQDS
jgi:CHAT domain-containing protein